MRGKRRGSSLAHVICLFDVPTACTDNLTLRTFCVNSAAQTHESPNVTSRLLSVPLVLHRL